MKIPVALVLVALSASCGKRGALVYPEMGAPGAPREVTVRQTGEKVRLSFRLPQNDLAGRALSDLGGVTIHRQERHGSACSACSAADLPHYRNIHLDYPGEDVRQVAEGRMVLLDGQVGPGMTYLYSLQGFLRNGTPGASSPPVRISIHPVPPPPGLQVSGTPTEVRLVMTAPAPGTGKAVGFAIYRTVKGAPFPYLPLTAEPVPGPEYLDFGIERGATYLYSVRSVVRHETGEVVEGAPSKAVEGRLAAEE